MTSAEASSSDDNKLKLELLRETYGEVLDATKHQDDKIGRLLTGLAFLTAASLALAGLSGATFLQQDFVVKPFVLPLGLISLGMFLVGVVLAVLLLMVGFGTPLRLPGQRPVSNREARRKSVAWANGIEGSPIFFFPIASLSIDEWRLKCDATPSEIERERRESLVYETHNLAARTTFKFDRVTEATSLVSLALVSFALAGLFVLFAADSPSNGPQALSLAQRLILAAVVVTATLLQVQARLRYGRQTVDETVAVRDYRGAGLAAVASRTFAAVVCGSLLLLVASSGRWSLGAAIAVMLGLVGTASLWLMILGPDWATGWKLWDTGCRMDRSRWRRRRGLLVLVIATALGLTVATSALFLTDLYGCRLIVAVALECALIAPSFAGPSLDAGRRRRDFESVGRQKSREAVRPSIEEQP